MDTEKQDIHLHPHFQTGTLGILSLLVTFCVMVLVIFIIYYNFLKYQAEKDLLSAQTQIQQLEKDIRELKAKNIQGVFSAQVFLSQLENEEIQWSKFIQRLNEVTPPEIRYSAFSVSEQGDVTISAFGPSFSKVGDLIETLRNNGYFYRVYIPSLTRGTEPSGSSQVSFGITMKYNLDRKQIKRN